MQNKLTITGAIFIVISIILGAMAAHALEKEISHKLIETFEKGVKYQMYIGLGLLVIGLNSDKFNFSLKPFYILNLIGVILFSGCIYAYSLHELIPELRPMAIIIPFGGISMIAAWIVLISQQILSNRRIN